MRLSIIHHIAIIVSDYEKSKDLFSGKRFTFSQIRTDFRSSFMNDFGKRDIQILKKIKK